MNTLEFLSELRNLRIQLSTDGEQLRCNAPKDVLTPSLRLELAERKAEIIAFLQDSYLAGNSTFLPIQSVPRNQNLPLSFAQQRLWFLDQLEPNSPFYNILRAVRLNGDLNIQVLQQALDAIVAHHEVLRTNYISENGNPIQVIAAPQSVELQIIDLQQYGETQGEIQLQKRLQQESQRPFNLTSDIMLRGCLLQLAPQEYVLLLVMHHIASDGSSTNILWEQLTQLYKAFLDGKPNPLPKLPIQYADHVVWQRQWLSDKVLDKQLNYWKQQLAGANPVLELPIDHPRPAVQTYRGASESLILPQSLSDGLKQLCRQQGVTLYMTLLAAFQTLLYRYSRQEDIIVGSPIAGRNRTEVEQLIGFFVNTLVLRTQFQESLSFTDVLKRVRQTAIEAYAHQDVPFEQLVQELQPQRSLSYSPLFQVMFALRNDVMGTPDFPGLTCSRLEMKSVAAKFDFFLSMKETQEGLIGYWEYNSDLFDRATIRRWISHFQVLLEGIVANPQQPVYQLPLLTESERHQLLVEWNDTATDYPQYKCIHQLFEEQVELTPDAVAVVFEHEQLTYRQLNSRANKLAHYLRSTGVKPEVLVGICVERSLEMVMGLLGILKAGGAYVPIDPDYPKERIAYMLKDSAVSVLLTQQKLLTSLPSHQASVVCWDIDSEAINSESEENLTTLVTPDQLSYINYTSGSTGVPKGVEVTHRGVTRLLFGVNYANLDAKQTFVQIAPISFDASTFEIWGALLHGSRCVIFSEKIPTSKELSHLITKNKITTLWLTSTLFNTIIDENPEALSGIRQLLIGGEALSVSHVRRGLKALPSTQIINGYGPTENTTFTCCYAIPSLLDSQGRSIPIGTPIANTQTYILDQHLQPVPIGIPGELHIGGAGLARGYLNRPQLTEQKFIPNPFSKQPGSRLYKTGDLARYLPDGNIEFLGRIDNQVKIRGFRIELSEIEATLTQHPQIQEAVVIVREALPGDKRLVAYVVSPGEKADILTTKLRGFLKQKLPQYMIPNAFVVLDALPLTPNGKVDRRGLPAPDTSRQSGTETFVAPRDSIELQLAQIWSQVLGIQPIGVTDNFFELGGHSLLAVRLVAEIEKVTQTKLPLAALFQFTTIEEIASLLKEPEVADNPNPNLSPELLPLDTDDLRALLTIVAGREGARPRPDSLMVTIRPTGVKPPLFYCANGVGEISTLARYLGEEQPVYFLESGYVVIGKKGQPTEANIKAIAASHVRDILEVYPTGPILLTGYSFGKNVAYEVAKQLQERGKKVAFIAILDTSGSGQMYRYYVQTIQSALVAMKKKLLRGSLLSFAQQLGSLLWEVKNNLTAQKSMSAVGANQGEYLMQGYSGKITLFLARVAGRHHIKIQRWLFPLMGWEEHVVDLIRVPGDHYSMRTEPHVRVLAERLKTCIDQALAAEADG
ncbi:MAG: amino acid adenylation domain-containing protein [Moorea sp. SIO4A3]|nr:amino acid adenylation domain-containing protein [Moorena sp. SIO4A3]